MAQAKMTLDMDEAERQISAAHEMVSALCHGDQRWVMSVPARPNDDPDLVIGAALRKANKLLAACESYQELLAAAQQREARLREACGKALTFHDRYCDRVGPTDDWARSVHATLRAALAADPTFVCDGCGRETHGPCAACGEKGE